jgi:hypothetical protein
MTLYSRPYGERERKTAARNPVFLLTRSLPNKYATITDAVDISTEKVRSAKIPLPKRAII